MKTDTAYFPHDIDASSDPKILELRYKMGSKGYGIFWLLVEILHNGPFGPDNLGAIAYQLREDIETIKSVLEDFDLFYVENGVYTSDRIKENTMRAESTSRRANAGAASRWNYEASALVNSVAEIFKNTFKKTTFKISSHVAKQIDEISEKENLSLDDWTTIITNAYRGWNIDGKNKKPSFEKHILKNWSAFLNDDFCLAPEKKEVVIDPEIVEQQKREAEEYELEQVKVEQAKNNIKDKNTAIEYILLSIGSTDFALKMSSTAKELMQQYNFSAKDVQEYENLLGVG